MKIYRVCTVSELDERIEGKAALLPGWRNCLTGFWTTSLEDAAKLLNDRHDYQFNCSGGGSWSKIHTTELSNVETLSEFQKYKDGDSPRFDKNELFVSKILDEDLVEVM